MADKVNWQDVRDRWTRDSAPLLMSAPPRESRFIIKRRLNFFVRPEVGIAITGMRGTGKSTLLKALRQRLTLGAYAERGESPDLEPDRFVAQTDHGKRHIDVVVVPGQKDSRQGRKAIRKYFKDGRAPTGIVHVVSWGFSTIWDPDLQRVALEQVYSSAGGPEVRFPEEIEKVRAYNLEGELDDFRQTCRLLQECWQASARPLWLIIVVVKPDLFRAADMLGPVGDYYIPRSDVSQDSEFAQELRALVNYLGEHRFGTRIAVLPVISYLEPYAAGGTSVPASGDADLMATLMTAFSNRIGEFCGDEQV